MRQSSIISQLVCPPSPVFVSALLTRPFHESIGKRHPIAWSVDLNSAIIGCSKSFKFGEIVCKMTPACRAIDSCARYIKAKRTFTARNRSESVQDVSWESAGVTKSDTCLTIIARVSIPGISSKAEGILHSIHCCFCSLVIGFVFPSSSPRDKRFKASIPSFFVCSSVSPRDARRRSRSLFRIDLSISRVSSQFPVSFVNSRRTAAVRSNVAFDIEGRASLNQSSVFSLCVRILEIARKVAMRTLNL
mmetsp:Transcript_4311/g.6451  ORF Transcript_4311/g.6451 Transcript_4311/m.6451 type:complete len:247 (+) Transcript_4311:1263-2003(+)